jgi:hypothetical protein
LVFRGYFVSSENNFQLVVKWLAKLREKKHFSKNLLSKFFGKSFLKKKSEFYLEFNLFAIFGQKN